MVIKYHKSTARLLSREYVHNRIHIILKRYCWSLWVKEQESYQLLKLEVKKNSAAQLNSTINTNTPALRPSGRIYFQTSNFDSQPIDHHKPIVPPWKDVNPDINILSVQESISTLKVYYSIQNILISIVLI